MSEEPQQRLRIGQDIRGQPIVAWQAIDGRFMCAWIEPAHDGSEARHLITAETDVLGGTLKGEPTNATLQHSGDDVDVLIAHAKANGAVAE